MDYLHAEIRALYAAFWQNLTPVCEFLSLKFTLGVDSGIKTACQVRITSKTRRNLGKIRTFGAHREEACNLISLCYFHLPYMDSDDHSSCMYIFHTKYCITHNICPYEIQYDPDPDPRPISWSMGCSSLDV
jgi:hypothetical protein